MDMKTCSKCGVEKELGEFHRNKNTKDGRTVRCKTCAIAATLAWARDNPEKHVAHGMAWEKAHPQKASAKRTRYRQNHPEQHRADVAKWRMANPEKHNAINRRYQKANPAVNAAKTARRRAGKLQATPAWANSFFISEAYALAKLRTERFVFSWHVDHIIPLVSPIVCGLHVENNLQVIPGADNISKSNRHWPDMPAA